jgi:hypothetical protein
MLARILVTALEGMMFVAIATFVILWSVLRECQSQSRPCLWHAIATFVG